MASNGYTTNLGQVDNSRTFALEGGPSLSQTYPIDLLPTHQKISQRVISRIHNNKQQDNLKDPVLKQLPKVPRYFL